MHLRNITRLNFARARPFRALRCVRRKPNRPRLQVSPDHTRWKNDEKPPLCDFALFMKFSLFWGMQVTLGRQVWSGDTCMCSAVRTFAHHDERSGGGKVASGGALLWYSHGPLGGAACGAFCRHTHPHKTALRLGVFVPRGQMTLPKIIRPIPCIYATLPG